ncbi:MAG: hypothetical protein AABY22_14845 [Nanoarchaeota archaeon]
MKNEDAYKVELDKFLNKKVIVKDQFGETFEGVLRAYNINHLNVILMTDKDKILIRNIANIRRVRSKDK